MSAARTAALDRINAVTANYFFWQGLRWVPVGAALLVVALSFSARTPVPESWKSPLLLVVMITALLLSAAAGRWYARSFGRVRGIPGQHARRTRTKWLVVYPALLAAVLVDAAVRPPVLVSGLAFAAAIEAYRRSTGGGRRHYVVASVLFAALTIAPRVGVATEHGGALNVLLALLGATYTIGGVMDHLELVRILPGAADHDDGLGDRVAGDAR